ncbi:LacI family DNA-binding transcriptional regulator [Microbacterium sp. ASV49]|uniref:LacI family DNA-binding transcriptional regulator n=1 Tax=Microbacterium candidum TaxID=3041922 RepID=A0ABT7MVI4_9MICO|nr:LacI family DNA-binding transcriptional regulator [Microbacterium sp. ASV49]MDL9978435.1 LacI family DNA-binding transcriptional regulator [Microbacterium sp. ASV49]
MDGAVGKVTIYDVAERAGVSISTVSLAINAPHRVSDETRSRVIEAATQLGYRRTPSRQRAETSALRIAVAAPFTSYPSYYRRLSGMLLHARRAAVDLIPHDLDSAASAADPLLHALPARGDVDGLIVMGVPLSAAALRASRTARLPVVLVDIRRERPSLGAPVVLIDDEAGGRLVGEHLRAAGHRRVGFVHERQLSSDYVSAGMLRARGILESVELVDVPVDVFGEPGPALREALAKDAGMTAVFANHDGLAAHTWRAIEETGRRVPDDIAVVGYDDGELAASLGLTTVRQPFVESGRAALDLVLAELSGEGTRVSHVELAPELVVRRSA